MDNHIPNLLALTAYMGTSLYIWACVYRQTRLSKTTLLGLSAICLSLHSVGIFTLMVTDGKIDMGALNMGSLILWSINLVVFLSAISKPLHNLFLFLFPLSSLAVAASLLLHQQPQIPEASPGIIAHILLSIPAYSLIAVATLQALLCSWQNKQLKQHRLSGATRLLPPLQTMESLVFDMLWAGQILLTLGIVAGLLTIDNIFAQQLLHKTVLSIFAWLIFATMLWGRHRLGWRGDIATRWVLSGFSLLMTGYFGSKVVIELLLA